MDRSLIMLGVGPLINLMGYPIVRHEDEDPEARQKMWSSPTRHCQTSPI